MLYQETLFHMSLLKRLLLCFLCVASFQWIGIQQAHSEETEEEVALLTKQIDEDLKNNILNPELYFRRGTLNYILDRFDQSVADFNVVLEILRKPPADLMLRRAKAYCGVAERTNADKEKIDSLQSALTSIDSFLKQSKLDSQNPEAHLVRSRILAKLGELEGDSDKIQDAARAHALVLANLPGNPSPNWFVKQAELEEQSGNVENALEWYEAGMSQNGREIPSILVKAVNFFQRQELYDLALSNLDKLIQSNSNNEDNLVLKAETLDMAGRSTEAVTVYNQVLSAIEDRPSSQQNSKRLQILKDEVETKLDIILDLDDLNNIDF